ncbi:MAG: helix-turn-helix domain-containing protein [Clostridia bacterium]|nr:helix-turn-helix domain-containing protein [Clostridia bacterium]
MNNYTFGNYICQLREKKGLSQADLGKILGVSNKAVSKWETGASYPSTEMMLPLAQALGTTIEELYTAVSQSKQPRTKLRIFLDTVFAYSKIWLPIVCGIALLCFVIYLIFGAPEQKLNLAIAAPLASVMVYGISRLMFWLHSKNPMVPSKSIDITEVFFLFVMVIAYSQSALLFITDIPNGFSPLFFAACAEWLALAQSHTKRTK